MFTRNVQCAHGNLPWARGACHVDLARPRAGQQISGGRGGPLDSLLAHDEVRCASRVGARSSTDRASDYGSEGWGFESLRARHLDHDANPRLTSAYVLLEPALRLPRSAPNRRLLQRCTAAASFLVLVEELPELVQGLSLIVQGHVPVDVHRHVDRGVTDDVHRGPRWNAQAQQHRTHSRAGSREV